MSEIDDRPKVLIIGPVPPPAFGVAKATRLMLDSAVLAARLQISHLDTSDRAGFTGIGRANTHNIRLGLVHTGRLVGLLAKTRPHVVLLTVSQNKAALSRDFLFAWLSRLFGARTVSYLRGSGYASIGGREGRLAQAMMRSIFKRSATVIVLSESLVAMAHTVYPRAHVAVVSNGSPPAVSTDLAGMRDESHPVLAYVGRLSRAKGLEDALLAVRQILVEMPDLEAVFCGEWDSPEFEARMRQLVSEYSLGDAVSFPGPVSFEQRAALLARAWVFIVPSHSEGQPWVILEAMSAGVPVVATDTGAVAETIQDGVGGFVVPVGDSAALAERAIALLTNTTLWRQLSAGASNRYRAHYTVERSHEVLAEELCSAAAGTRLDGRAMPAAPVATSGGSANAVSEWFATNATRWDSGYGTSALFSERLTVWSEAIERYGPRGCRILDAGCGSGAISVIAARRAREVVGVDSSPQMLEICGQRCASAGVTNCTLVPGPIEGMRPEALGSFDLVLASSVLEYIDDLTNCLGALAGLLRPQSALCVSLPNSRSVLRKAEAVSYRLTRRPGYWRLIRNAPSEPALQNLLREAGLAPVSITYFGVPRALRLVSRLPFAKRRIATMALFVATKVA
jgi:glycosyltransferase involved in cell wall biosynthesis/ubiquinone/menaquinone biosynthesis C-methylase UbiE